jgi:hypothetical protein
VSLPWAEFLFSDGFHWQEWDRPRVIVRTQRAGLKNLLHSVVYSCFNKNQMISPRVASLPKWKEYCRGIIIFYWIAIGGTICFLTFNDHLGLSLLFGVHPFLPQGFS